MSPSNIDTNQNQNDSNSLFTKQFKMRLWLFLSKKGTTITQDVYQEPSTGIHLRYRCLLPVRVQSVLVEPRGIEPLSEESPTRTSTV